MTNSNEQSRLTNSEKVAILEDYVKKLGYEIPYNEDKYEDRRDFWLGEDSSLKEDDNSGYVYFVQEEMNGTVKIGKTKNPRTRLRLFEVKLPFEIEVINKVHVSDRHKAETKLHEHYKANNQNGEWFELGSDEIDLIKNDEFPVISDLVI